MMTESSSFFSKKVIDALRKKTVPSHIAIIMDGNRRWAKNNKLSHLKSTFEGHNAGAIALLNIIRASIELGIKVLTVYGFSTENRSRSHLEVQTIYKIIEKYLKDNFSKMVDEGIKFNFIGDISPFPEELKEIILKSKEKTKHNNKLELFLALNYGARDEITRALKSIIEGVSQGRIGKEEISEKLIEKNLDTQGVSDPDLLIRTSGEMRISNFLLWQLAYAEIYVTKTLWPDFYPSEFLKAILEFQKRERRIGK